MRKSLLILGAGQYGMLVREVAIATKHYAKIAFLDDQNPEAIGKLSDYEHFFATYTYAFVAIGDTATRMAWLNRLKEAGYEIARLVDPQSFFAPSARLGVGSIVEPMAVVQCGAVVGEGSMIASGAVVKHNAIVGNGCYIDCNSVILPGAVVPDGTKVSANTILEA